MKIKTKTVFGFLRVFAIMLVFTISTNLNATTHKVNSALSSELQFTSLNLVFSPLTLAVATVGDNDRWKRGFPNKIKDNTGYKKPRQNKPKQKKGCCNGPCNHTPPDETPTPGDDIPLDGGLSFLVLGAAAFGIRKLRKEKNDKI
ncbi:hypothetical protein Q4566_06620 [Tamlana sp. 2_MG-2023]|uniref:PID-CTERM protein-sorting domain-containing protein n=1 Tax=unclassified Tamlana TaxID=2614803 RepID=UPI0026E46464|nr:MULTISPECIES: hypothetical protein [unclassified Tamlana]MDO6759869.1 hypothetical protein [Tamlana sp. 2_MG-2023]MDO6791961.1 hypothetical protein [Tamlana sp. 1_MG-2023]